MNGVFDREPPGGGHELIKIENFLMLLERLGCYKGEYDGTSGLGRHWHFVERSSNSGKILVANGTGHVGWQRP